MNSSILPDWSSAEKNNNYGIGVIATLCLLAAFLQFEMGGHYSNRWMANGDSETWAPIIGVLLVSGALAVGLWKRIRKLAFYIGAGLASLTMLADFISVYSLPEKVSVSQYIGLGSIGLLHATIWLFVFWQLRAYECLEHSKQRWAEAQILRMPDG